MEILFQSNGVTAPELSIVLLDWSCRESFHIFDYLSSQAVDRSKFEILWVEYYERRAEEIEAAIRKSQLAGDHPPVAKWLVLDMPRDRYYHKHLMYNVGIIASTAKIVTFCDSDGIVSKNFVASIIESFDQDRNIVLHMDQVRNGEEKYYPFNYPSLEEVITRGKKYIVHCAGRAAITKAPAAERKSRSRGAHQGKTQT